MFDALDLTATGSGYYRVWVDGVQVSQHTTEREATERAVERKLADPLSVVSYDHDYSVRVDTPNERRSGYERRQVDVSLSRPGLRQGQRRRAVSLYPVTPPVLSVSITTPPPVALEALDTYQFAAQVSGTQRIWRDEPSGVSDWVVETVVLTGRTVTWTSSDTGVATIDSNGLLTAVAGGTTNITAKSEGVTSVAIAATVGATAPTVATVTVTPTSFTVFTGATFQLTATAKDSGGNTIPGLSATWATSNGAVATVGASTGLVTGVAAGSATITATISAVNGTSACTAAVAPSAGTLLTFSNADLGFVLGPLLVAGDGLLTGSATLSAFPWPHFDRTWDERGTYHAARSPTYWPQQLQGTVAITNNTSTVTGTGTSFLTRIDPSWYVETLYGNANYWGEIMIQDAAGVWQGPFYASSVASDTSFTLTAPWTFGNVTGVAITTNNPTRLSGQKQADLAGARNYYDTAFCLYQRAYAANDATMLTAARKVADAWLSSPGINNGYGTGQSTYAPRSQSYCGMIVRAIELDIAGTPHAIWDWLVKSTAAKWPTWIGNRLANSSLYYGLRDGAYVVLATALLAKVLPNSYLDLNGATVTTGATTRTTYRQRARDAAVDYYARLQGSAPDASAGPPGLWRWDDTDESPPDRSQSVSFQYGLVGEALITTHRLLVETSWGTAADITTIENTITKMCEAMHETDSASVASWTYPMFRQGVITNRQPTLWRAFWYRYYGGVDGDLTRYMPNSLNQLASVTESDAFNKVAEARQNNGMNISVFGYAYYLTGNAKFLQYGDDVAAATFGTAKDNDGTILDTVGVGADAYSGLQWGDGKNYNECYRNTAHYFAWRSGLVA